MAAGDNVVDFVPKQHRHERALREANRRDMVWLRNNSDRIWRARRLIPYEFPDGGCDGHNLALVRFNYVLNDIERLPLKAQVEIPDNDSFLGALWYYIHIHHRPGERLDIEPFTHQILLDLTGNSHGVMA